MITGILTSRVRVVAGSTLSMLATDLATAKLSTMVANAKIASMQATKVVATKLIAKATALWMLLMSFIIPIQQTAPVIAHPQAIHGKQVVKVNPIVVAPQRQLFLHTFEKQYTCVFIGKVTCGNAPCATANIEVHISSKKNPNLIKSVPIQPDGRYEVSFLLKEYLHEHLDWWIVADSPDSASKQIQGREILMEDANIQIEQPISLL